MSDGTTRSVAWVEGVGASASLGATLARRFAREGYSVALTGRSEERLQEVAAEIREAGGRAHAFAGDISLAADAARLSGAVRSLAAVPTAIFIAGNMVRGTALDLSPEQFEATWRGSMPWPIRG